MQQTIQGEAEDPFVLSVARLESQLIGFEEVIKGNSLYGLEVADWILDWKKADWA